MCLGFRLCNVPTAGLAGSVCGLSACFRRRSLSEVVLPLSLPRDFRGVAAEDSPWARLPVVCRRREASWAFLAKAAVILIFLGAGVPV